MELLKFIETFILKITLNLFILLGKGVTKGIGAILISFGSFLNYIASLLGMFLGALTAMCAILAVLSGFGIISVQDTSMALSLVVIGIFLGLCRMFVQSIPEWIIRAGYWFDGLMFFVDIFKLF